MITFLAVLLLGAAGWLWAAPGPTAGPSRQRPAPRLRRPGPRRSTLALATEQNATFIRQLAALLRAGIAPAAAFGLLADIWSTGRSAGEVDIHRGCTRALAQIHTGGTLQEGLSAHGASHPLPRPENRRLWNRLAWCFAICEQSGAALADLLDTLAEEQESAADLHRALHAALAGPRATSRLLTILPGIGLGLGQLLGINPFVILTMNPVGRIALLCGVILWLVNKLWCAQMLRAITAKVPS